MDNPLLPQRAEDAHVLYDILVEDLEATLGSRPEIGVLALLAARHLMGEEMLRFLLIGESGSGKTFLAREVARILDVPFLEMSVTNMSEEGWKGAGPSEHLATLFTQAALRSRTQTAAIRAAQRAVVFIDELDKARLAPPSGSASSRENRVGKQLSLLPLIGDGSLTIERSTGHHLEWRSRGALVICAGVFEGLPAGVVSAEALADWGLLPELAERLVLGTILRLPQKSRDQLLRVLQQDVQPLQQLFARFGYTLHVSQTALNYVALNLVELPSTGARSASGILRRAAEAGLLRMLTEGVPTGSSWTLGPDDVELPPQSKGVWRD